MTDTMMRSTIPVDTEIDLGDYGDSEDSEDSEGQQPWKTQLETVMEEEEEEEEEEEDMVSTQSDTRPLINERDPRQMNECLKVSFEDVIAEPLSVRTGDRVWFWSNALFEVSRVWFYRIVTAVLAIPFSIVAGVLFAFLTCLHIWLLTPCVKVIFMNTSWLERLWRSLLDIFILPVYRSVSKSCTSISM
ncbi:caveolin-2 [Ictalurus punctatus]|uniref:Caveolin n=1 Tax=Ictalurus punctatus TaxID=7998 RepID=A0A2D0TB10_ICTPU|nr:caveolin-2 [Ictalurus punctatus]